MEKRVIFTNFITEKELDSLFRMADLLMYPSLYEGFGIPILEAMKIGIPVITSNVTAMPEVAGEGALLVDPHSIKDMTDGMAKILNDKKFTEELKSKGPGIAKEFTWERTSESYLKLYEDISS